MQNFPVVYHSIVVEALQECQNAKRSSTILKLASQIISILRKHRATRSKYHALKPGEIEVTELKSWIKKLLKDEEEQEKKWYAAIGERNSTSAVGLWTPDSDSDYILITYNTSGTGAKYCLPLDSTYVVVHHGGPSLLIQH